MKALFPGSFDPFTPGHEAIARRALRLFDQLVIAVGVNTDKHYLFSPEERVARIRDIFADIPQVEVTSYSGMTIDICHQLGATCIVRGIRTSADLDYEQTISAVNHKLDSSIETVLLLADDEHRDISSTLLREQLSHDS
ncbi:MAG: pantetheine-phosphate adenylyltransferase [Bacteroidales bacterium]|nr:pantetheine-phosphate adenylyltransferase [Bacteroidales bacterium]